MLKLGVNIDHVATVRQARLAQYPSPVEAAILCEKAGAWGITAHLREDRRHVNDKDIRDLKARVNFLNMEMAATDEMLQIAKEVRPNSSCLVPEKRQELTTEGGLDVLGQLEHLAAAVKSLHESGIIVSIFIDPDLEQISAAQSIGADYIELHTGSFANSSGSEQRAELDRLIAAAGHANGIGLKVNAGHGIDYQNIAGILEIPHLQELNIGHSIVARAVIVGMENAVREMINLMRPYNK